MAKVYSVTPSSGWSLGGEPGAGAGCWSSQVVERCFAAQNC